jgi:hypothetical protein
MCIIMNIETYKIIIKNNCYCLFLSLIMKTFSKVTIPHGMWHITCMKYKSIYIYNFDNNNAYTTNWENIESQALELTTKKWH